MYQITQNCPPVAWKKFRRWALLALATLLLACYGFFLGYGWAEAEDTDTLVDPPTLQQANGYTLEYLAAGSTAPKAGERIALRLRVSDASGKPVDGLTLQLAASRNYSGQVTKEYNGPRSPNLGPLLFQPTGQPGIYEANLKFDANGRWFVQVSGADLKEATVQFRQPVEVAANSGAGFNADWVIWPVALLIVLGAVVIIRNTGEKFPAVPSAELEPARIVTEGGN